MNIAIVERSIRCPFCAESISVLLDLSAGDQSYIEDCQVCCQPIEIAYEADGGDCTNLRVNCAS